MSTGPRPLEQLPVELWAMVIDHHRDDSQTLKRCVRVCRHWVPFARKHLFFGVVIKEKQILEAFTHLNEQRPAFVRYVRRLTMVRAEFTPYSGHLWLAVLAHFDKVEMLIARRWPNVHMTESTRLELRHHFPAVKVLRFEDLNMAEVDLLALARACPQLAEIHLKSVCLSVRNKIPAPPHIAHPTTQDEHPHVAEGHITVLSMIAVPQQTGRLVFENALHTHLTHLQIGRPDGQSLPAYTLRLLRATKETLVELVLAISGTATRDLNGLPATFPWPSGEHVFLRRLKRIHIKTALLESQAPDAWSRVTPVTWVTHLLERMFEPGRPATLECITISLRTVDICDTAGHFSLQGLNGFLTELVGRPIPSIVINICDSVEKKRWTVSILGPILRHMPILMRWEASVVIKYGQRWDAHAAFGGCLVGNVKQHQLEHSQSLRVDRRPVHIFMV
ncbi:predicted protein [Postia placenta Mad-698-R]|nr:predicted protein [Postia placenta Mad-698-R]